MDVQDQHAADAVSGEAPPQCTHGTFSLCPRVAEGLGHSDPIHGGSTLVISSPPKATTPGVWIQPEFWGDTHSDHSRMTPLNDVQDSC